MILVLNAVLPVFLLAALGFTLFRIGFINAEMSRGLNQLVYWVGLPCLLFHKIAHETLNWDGVRSILFAFFVALALTIGLAYLVVALLRLDRNSMAAFVQASFRGNLGFIGLPIVLYSVDATMVEETSSLAALTLAPCAIAFNVLAVALMIIHQPRKATQKVNFVYAFVTNPLIIGGMLGIVAASFQWHIPLFLDRSIEGLSDLSVPAALLGLGSSIGVMGNQGFNRAFIKVAGSATLIKVVVSPSLGILFSLIFGLNSVEARIVTVYLATPTAIASHVIVGQFRGDEKLAASAIVSATVGSVFFLPIALWVTQPDVWSTLTDRELAFTGA